MQSATEAFFESGWFDRVITDNDCKILLGGTDASRYALINKSISKNELIRLCRGIYVLADKYRRSRFSEFYLSNKIVPFSYVSAESALSFHDMTPERVTMVTAIAPSGRKREFKTPLGYFSYAPAYVVAPKLFYAGVEPFILNEKQVLVARPLRAILDLVYWHRLSDISIDFLSESLRIEADDVAKFSKAEIELLRPVYSARYIQNFLNELEVFVDG